MSPLACGILVASLVGSAVLVCGAGYGLYRFGQAVLDGVAQEMR